MCPSSYYLQCFNSLGETRVGRGNAPPPPPIVFFLLFIFLYIVCHYFGNCKWKWIHRQNVVLYWSVKFLIQYCINIWPWSMIWLRKKDKKKSKLTHSATMHICSYFLYPLKYGHNYMSFNTTHISHIWFIQCSGNIFASVVLILKV